MVSVKLPCAFVVFPVICFVIVSSHLERSTVETFLAGSSANNPDNKLSVIFGIIIANTESPLLTVLVQTPVTGESTAAKVILVPTPEMAEILLKFGSIWPAVWYLTIASVFIPVTPLKNLPGTVPVFPPVIVSLSVILKSGGDTSYKTLSAIKSLWIVVLSVVESWYTDLMSWVLCSLIVWIATCNSWFSLIITCSPIKNVPEVWDRL